jgi:hypothetical protein
MRCSRTFRLSAVLALATLASPIHAQEPSRPRSISASRLNGGYESRADWQGVLQSYGSSAARGDRDGRAYSRMSTPVARRIEITPTRATTPHNYFPTQGRGLYPNRNYIPPDRLCVPGRRPFLYR